MRTMFAFPIIALGAAILIIFVVAVILIVAILLNSQNNQRNNRAGMYYQQPNMNRTMNNNPNDMNCNGIPDAMDPNPYSQDSGNQDISNTGFDNGSVDTNAGTSDSFHSSI